MLTEKLSQERLTLERIAARADKSLENAPQGSLRTTKIRGTTRYYRVMPDGDSAGTYLSARHDELVSQLVQKEYDEKASRLAKQQIRAIDNMLNNVRWGFEKHSIQQIFDSMPPCKQKLVTPYALSDEAYAARWQETTFTGKAFANDTPRYFTERGERVRSKSEALIASALMRHKVPYHYEKPLVLSGGTTIYPDFTVLNKRTRDVFYWEHFGMLDDVEYLNRALQRLDSYEKTRLFMGKQLIVTRESRKRPLETEAIDRAIQTYLL